MALLNQNSVLPVLPSTTLQASAADISLSNHVLSITGVTPMDYRKINSATGGIWPNSLVEVDQVYTITPVAANSTEFGLSIQQFVPAHATTNQYFGGVDYGPGFGNGQLSGLGRLVTEQLYHTTPATGATATTICDAWRTQLALLQDVQITGSGTSTLILTANSRNPLFFVTATTPGITIVNTTSAPIAIVSSTDATPIVVTTAASTYVVGQTVTVAGHATNTNANGTWRVSATNGTTTVTLQGSTATGGGAGGATGTVVRPAQASKGYSQDLLNAGITPSLVTDGAYYSQTVFDYNALAISGAAANTVESRNTSTLYVNESATNFADFATRMNEILNAYPAGGSTYPDHEALAIG